MMTCPAPAKLRQLLDEALAPDEFRTIEAHLEECQSCRTVLDGLAATLGNDWPASFLRARQPRPQPAHFAGQFQPRRFHARGGLGEVYEVHDEQFHRPVALKVLQARHSADADNRQRFLREAEITAQLEHPGIVPVYNFAEVEDGRPGYAMRLVQGETLRDAIQRFHEPAGPLQEESERRLALRALLNQFIAACNPVAFAHSRGFLHRDLKPANIMLGPFGETLVLDWGLAKRFGADQQQSTEETRALGPEQMAEANGTLVSQVSGTPGFMSPEQAAGPGAVVGPATDIYSLGATLYCLLTGQAPFPAPKSQEDWEAIQQQIRTGDFPAPRALKTDIPSALEAICLKAMALRPEDRYATVPALAADLERWLAGEPVSARLERWWERGLRWLKRHRVLTTAAAVGVLIALVSLTVATAMLRVAYGREQHARDVAEMQRAKADLHLGNAVTAVDFYLRQVHGFPPDGKLAGGGALEPLRGKEEATSPKKRLEALSEMYRQLQADRDDQDPRFLQLTGHVLHGMGTCYALLGNQQEAEKHYLQSLALQERLLTRFPPEKDYPYDFAFTACALRRQYGSWGHPDKAAKLLTRINEIFESLRATPAVAGCLAAGMAYQFRQFGPPEEALIWYGKATGILEVQHQQEPDNANIRVASWTLLVAQAVNCTELNQHAQAVKYWDRLLQMGGDMPPPVTKIFRDLGGDTPPLMQVRIYRAMSLAKEGDYVRATAEAEALAGAPGGSSLSLYNLACVFAPSVASVRHDPKLPRDEADRLAKHYAVQALALLTRARDAGVFQIQGALENFKKDTDLDPLRARADFQKFLADVEKARETNQPPVNPPPASAPRP